jgi:ABC-2 type transport system permease protein
LSSDLSRAHQVPGAGTVLAELFFGQVLMVTAFSAFGFLAGAITSRYVIIGLGYAGVIEAGVGQIPTQISQLSMSNLSAQYAHAVCCRTWPLPTRPACRGRHAVVLLFTLVMVGAAVAVFTLREQSGPAES